MPVMIFIVAQLLLGCGGSPLLTLGTTYVDDHVRPESSSMYIGKSYFVYETKNFRTLFRAGEGPNRSALRVGYIDKFYIN